MTLLRCNTVQEAIWERAASAGPAPLSSAMVEHMTSCPACRSERRAVEDLVETSRSIEDPPPPDGLWERFDRELDRRLDALDARRSFGRVWDRWGRRLSRFAAVLAVGFGLGVLATEASDDGTPAASGVRPDLAASVEAELANDARLESYLADIEDLLVEFRAGERGDAIDAFRGSIDRPVGMVAGPGVPSEADRIRLERQRAAREQIRGLVLGMLASEIESESRGFGYIDRRIAAIAGQQLLYFVR